MRAPSSKKCRLDLVPPWADRFILGITPSITARYFSAGPSDSILRYSLDGHPALRSTASGGFRSVLACVQLSPSCPFRRLHTFRFLRPARLRTPLLGYGAPHLSARGTSTLLNNALLSAHFLFADNSPRTSCWLPTRPHVRDAYYRQTHNLRLNLVPTARGCLFPQSRLHFVKPMEHDVDLGSRALVLRFPCNQQPTVTGQIVAAPLPFILKQHNRFAWFECISGSELY